MAKITLIKTDVAIDKMIMSIASRGSKLQDDTHRVLASIAVRWHDTNDVTVAVRQINALIESLPSGWRTNAVKAWVESFLTFVWDTDEKCFVYNKNRTKISKDDARAAMDTPYWEFKPESEYKPLNLDDMIYALIARAEKRREQGLKDGDIVPSDKVKALKALVA